MYASYNSLYDDCAQTPFTAYTDNSRFTCSSLPIQKQVRKSIYSNKLYPLNVPCTHESDCVPPDSNCQYQCAQEATAPTVFPIKSKEDFKVMYSNDEQPMISKTKLSGQSHDKLLPVMDPQFNLREICKQSILLEDHLSHNEKRCFDCCVKHFLTIEALAEEAITLDQSDSVCLSKIQQLPSRVRTLQSKWHEDPDKNSHVVSQELRKIRKDFQLDAFDVVFRSSCQDGVCRIK